MQLVAKKGVTLYRDYYLDTEVKTLPIPAWLKVPIACLGEPVVWRKIIGDTVQKQEVLAIASKHNIPIYAPAGGVLRDILTIPEQGRNKAMQVALLETKSTTASFDSSWSTEMASTKEGLREIIRRAGILNESTGLYLYEELPENAGYDTILLDAVDEQPFDLSRTGVLAEWSREVVDGVILLMHAFGIPVAEALLMKNFRTKSFFQNGLEGMTITQAKGKYPLSPVMQKYAAKKNALRVGPFCCRAVYRAAVFSEPQLSSVVTVWGEGVEQPANVEIPNGALVQDLLSFCEARGSLQRVVGGGVMTGYAATLSFPLYRYDRVLTAQLLKPKQHKTVDCINCGRCASVCPEGLAPYYITRSSRKIGEERARRLTAERCIGCGACAYICPARIPLTEKIRLYQQHREATKP